MDLYNKRNDRKLEECNKKVVGSGIDFIPTSMFSYDDRCLGNERIAMPVLSGTQEDRENMLKTVSKYLDPVNGAINLNQVSHMTFNANDEGSGLEPSEEWGYSKIE